VTVIALKYPTTKSLFNIASLLAVEPAGITSMTLFKAKPPPKVLSPKLATWFNGAMTAQ